MINLEAKDLENINTALETIKDLRRELKRAQQAGITLEFTEADLDKAETQLLAIKRTYFPSGTTKK
jgi:hypothetical protein